MYVCVCVFDCSIGPDDQTFISVRDGIMWGGEGELSLAYASSGSERNAISELFPNFLDPA